MKRLQSETQPNSDTANAGKDVEQREATLIAGEKTGW